MSDYITNPSSYDDFKRNIDFHIQNVQGWVSVNDYEGAMIKALCLCDEIRKLIDYQNNLMSENVAASIAKEISRVTQLKNEYLQFPKGAGKLAASLMEQEIESAQKAQASDNIDWMIRSIKALNKFEL
jgi:hypothetical protein